MSRIYLPSASALERANRCLGSVVYPRVFESSGFYAKRGTDIHAFLVRAKEVGREEALAELDLEATHRAFCEAIPLDRLPKGGEHEVAYAFNVKTRTARVLGQDIARAYLEHGWDPESEIPGSLDLDGVVGDVAQVVDYKSGFQSLGPPAKSWQLRFGALVACRARGLDRARAAFYYLREDGTFYEDPVEFNSFDLLEIEEEMVALAERVHVAVMQYVNGHQPNLAIGGWCERCASFPVCPAQAAIARSIARVEDAPLALTPETAAKAWAILDAYDLVAERARRALRDYAKVTPFPLAGGKELRLAERKTVKLDLVIARAVLADRYGEAVAQTAVRSEVTQTSIEDAIRAIAKSEGKPLAPIKKEILVEIEQRRGLTTLSVPQVRACSVPKDKPKKKVALRLEGKAPDEKPTVDVTAEGAADVA